MIKEWLRRKAVERATIRELNALTNRDLTDIGINRDEIRQIAKSTKDLF